MLYGILTMYRVYRSPAGRRPAFVNGLVEHRGSIRVIYIKGRSTDRERLTKELHLWELT